MLVGTVTKQEGIWWSAHCDIAGIFTQGKSKADAMRALADAFEDVINRPGFKATVTALDGDEVRVEASDPALLLGIVLLAWHFLLTKEHQRQPATTADPSPEPESTG